ncbi:MAG: hypothetical protein KBT46_07085, partial [Ruminococcus sp.]|nr:hypothetical protein [Candidatus Copronaster equi]
EYCDTFISAGFSSVPFSRGMELLFLYERSETDEQIKRCFIRQRVKQPPQMYLYLTEKFL